MVGGHVLYEITHGHLSRSETRSSYGVSEVEVTTELMLLANNAVGMSCENQDDDRFPNRPTPRAPLARHRNGPPLCQLR